MSDRARHIFVITLVVALVLASLVVAVGIPGVVKAQKTRLGLDLKGGTELIYQARTYSGKPVSSTQLGDAINIMRSRSDTLGVSGVSITAFGQRRDHGRSARRLQRGAGGKGRRRRRLALLL